MLELYFKRSLTVGRFRSSPAGPYLDGLAAALHEMGYSYQAGGSCLRHAVHLGRWAASDGIAVEAIDEDAIGRFEAHAPSCSCPHQRAGRHDRAAARARVFLGYLRATGVASATATVTEAADNSPMAVQNFAIWMRHHRGVTESTLQAYAGAIRAFVADLGEDPTQYTAQDIRRVVRDQSTPHGLSKAKQVATAIRMYLRYLAAVGRASPHLADAIPRVASWRLTTLPRHLAQDDVARLIASCDSETIAGLRDRAVLLLLSRLGLRAGDVVDLNLSDIDWSNARFQVAGKSRRAALLPLPQEVGDAIATYIERGRPCVDTDRVFVTVRPPVRPLGSSPTVSRIVARAIRRAGVSAQTHGAHLLRHSAAIAMLCSGASLQGIGTVLRHQSVETTAHYARVDVRLLRQVAQPWLEVEP